MKRNTIVFAYMVDGTSVSKETDRGIGGIDAMYALKMEDVHRAQLIVAVDKLTGKSVVLKNRWGPRTDLQESYLRGGVPIPGTNMVYVDLKTPPFVPTKNVILDNLVPESDQHPTTKTASSLSPGLLADLRAITDWMVEKRYDIDKAAQALVDSIQFDLHKGKKDFEPVPRKSSDIAADSNQTCRCNIKDLMSNGHSSGCPEKRR